MVINPNPPNNKIKGFVDMKRMSSVKLVPYLRNNR